MGERGAGPQSCCRDEAHRLCRGRLAAPSIDTKFSGNLRRRNNFLAGRKRGTAGWRRSLVEETRTGLMCQRVADSIVLNPEHQAQRVILKRKYALPPTKSPNRAVLIAMARSMEASCEITVHRRTMRPDYPPRRSPAIPTLSRRGLSRIGKECWVRVHGCSAPYPTTFVRCHGIGHQQNIVDISRCALAWTRTPEAHASHIVILRAHQFAVESGAQQRPRGRTR